MKLEHNCITYSLLDWATMQLEIFAGCVQTTISGDGGENVITRLNKLSILLGSCIRQNRYNALKPPPGSTDVSIC